MDEMNDFNKAEILRAIRRKVHRAISDEAISDEDGTVILAKLNARLAELDAKNNPT